MARWYFYANFQKGGTKMGRVELAEEWGRLPDETKAMARQIIISFTEKGLSICDAKEVFRACEVYMEANGKVSIAN
jgi:hypothetical protein